MRESTAGRWGGEGEGQREVAGKEKEDGLALEIWRYAKRIDDAAKCTRQPVHRVVRPTERVG